MRSETNLQIGIDFSWIKKNNQMITGRRVYGLLARVNLGGLKECEK